MSKMEKNVVAKIKSRDKNERRAKICRILNEMKVLEGRLGGPAVERLPSAQVVIPGSWDRVPHQAPRREPASPSAHVSASLSLSVSHDR